ncbi:hypothetical protein KMZ29_05415 [Bradyrhizobium sediminis]|uniref:Uncharacterized protein n=1 Tax=Bradyrhizobium sediminis TaxID=2840469 RepID=A0A975NH99_9BRAD|nr:hypothetical protein [Bradyrhizobium sediminis]QWG14134.1 hypothetical protein KMZ29_05415 [Bradyrhizobium sediminis]
MNPPEAVTWRIVGEHRGIGKQRPDASSAPGVENAVSLRCEACVMPVEPLLLLDGNREPAQPILEKIGLFSRLDLPL